MSVAASLREYVRSLVHVSAETDALSVARHTAFIAPRLLGGFSALAVLPIELATRGMPSPLESAVFGWLIGALLGVHYLSRTGNLDRAHQLSSLALTGSIAAAAAMTGGPASCMTMLLIAVPLEAALSGSRRVITSACVMTAAALCLLLAARFWGPTTEGLVAQSGPPLAAIVGAALYATGLALGSGSLAHVGQHLSYAEEARYRLLASNMTDVMVRHGRTGAVIFISPAAERLIGVPVSTLRGHRLFERVHVADRPAYLTALSDAANTGLARSVEFRLRRGPDEAGDACPPHFIWVEMRCRLLERPTGEDAEPEREVVSVLRDVTDRKLQEQAIEDARLEAVRANAAKGRFLATMSHELRTPLNAIIGFSEMLASERELNLDAARRHDYAQLINDSGQHLLSVVNGILDMSRIETGNFEITPEPFALDPVIAGCCQLLALKAHEAGIDLVHRHDQRLPEIVADKRAVKQMLLNLVSNAIKFTRDGGRVTVSASVDPDTVAIAVSDTGIGIADSDLKQLGSPFFQVRGSYDRPHDGTGLGLSIVKGLVELHGGRLEIHSQVGEGTRVTIRLPINCESGPGRRGLGRPDSAVPVAILPHVTDQRMKKSA